MTRDLETASFKTSALWGALLARTALTVDAGMLGGGSVDSATIGSNDGGTPYHMGPGYDGQYYGPHSGWHPEPLLACKGPGSC